MIKISKQTKVAVLVIFGLGLFIYMFSFLKGIDLFSRTHIFYTTFEYNALSTSSPVMVKGNRVGKIEHIQYDFEKGNTIVEFSVNPKLKFSKNSTIKLYETGLMGGNALAIVNAEDTNFAQPGDTISSFVQPGLLSSIQKNFSGLSTDLDKTIRSADTLMTSLNSMVLDNSDVGIKATITELNQTLKSFKKTSGFVQNLIKTNDQKIKTILDSFSIISKNLAHTSEDLKRLELSKVLSKFDASLASINALMTTLNNGEGTMGKLLKDDALYKNFEAASKELELLLLDIKLHPARYRRILSKREIPYQKPTPEQLNKE